VSYTKAENASALALLVPTTSFILPTARQFRSQLSMERVQRQTLITNNSGSYERGQATHMIRRLLLVWVGSGWGGGGWDIPAADSYRAPRVIEYSPGFPRLAQRQSCSHAVMLIRQSWRGRGIPTVQCTSLTRLHNNSDFP
jgi:hypothetical protein